MEQIKIRTLRADEIDVRVGTVKDGKGISFLLYKDARCDMSILDEVFGPMNWKREHTRDNANCIVSIWDDDKKAWVSKEDTGTESNTEKEKGLASDSFKRACFNWGIGRELYSAPFIWIATPNTNDLKYEKLKVLQVHYNDKREIMQLTIADSKGNILYAYGNPAIKAVPYSKGRPVTQPVAATQPTAAPKDNATMAAQTANAFRAAKNIVELDSLWQRTQAYSKDLADIVKPVYEECKNKLLI